MNMAPPPTQGWTHGKNYVFPFGEAPPPTRGWNPA